MNDQYKLSMRRPVAAAAERTPRSAADLSLDTAPRKAADQRSSDPYNTSGSFDRTKNWARVGKR
jgi:hypothetical protein